jgi:hypothetical protein
MRNQLELHKIYKNSQFIRKQMIPFRSFLHEELKKLLIVTPHILLDRRYLFLATLYDHRPSAQTKRVFCAHFVLTHAHPRGLSS